MVAKRTIKITNKLGIHVRPAAQLAELANQYQSNITFIKDGQRVNAKSIIELLSLGASGGSTITMQAEGADAEPLLDALQRLIATNFGEE